MHVYVIHSVLTCTDTATDSRMRGRARQGGKSREVQAEMNRVSEKEGMLE